MTQTQDTTGRSLPASAWMPTSSATNRRPGGVTTSSASTTGTSKTSNSAAASQVAIWGRTSFGRSWWRSLVAALPGVLAPVACISVFITLAQYDGCFSRFAEAVAHEGFWTICRQYGPQLTWRGTAAVTCWVGLQALLFRYLPGEVHTGQYTPAGHLLTYRINGLMAWIITHALYLGLSWAGILDPGFIPRNWSSLIAAMNLMGLLVSAFAYIKANSFYDFYMGIELNPRLGNDFDFKLFSNGRPGIVAWTMVDYSNMAYQYQTQGRVEPSLILVSLLQTVYVIDFFVNEAWYLRTIDIAHDHFGFYLAWGTFCFLPTTYTIQGQYLGLYPGSASTIYLTVWFIVGAAGYIIFRSANDQKDRARRSGGDHKIWGKKAQYVQASYRTLDGKEHQTLLLCSGWWGWSRHANYTGDLLISYSTCALVGSSKAVVWIYAIWMTVLLIHRCMRDEKRCGDKYGPAWTEYCKRVPWRFVRGIW